MYALTLLAVKTIAPTFGSPWIQIGQDLKGPQHNISSATAFGWSVSISSTGREITIGAPGDVEGLGRVYSYKYNELTDWWESYGAPLQGDEFGCEFGNSTHITDNGKFLAVGARQYRNGAGQAYVYEFDSGSWQIRGQPLNGTRRNGNFGNAVSLSSDGTRLAVSSAFRDVTLENGVLGENVGMVQFFEYSPTTNEWRQVGRSLQGTESYEKFGFAIKLSSSGEILAVGAPFHNKTTYEDDASGWRGLVKIYKYDWKSGHWVQMGDTIFGANETDGFGWSVDLSTAGDKIAVGAPLNGKNGQASGQARIYSFDSTSQEWKPYGLLNFEYP